VGVSDLACAICVFLSVNKLVLTSMFSFTKTVDRSVG